MSAIGSVASLAAAGARLAVAAEVVEVALPLRRPHVTAHGTEADRGVVLVRLVDASGHEGWGECAAFSTPGYSPEWTGGAWDVLADRLLPSLLAGGSGADPAHPMASAAVEAAAIELALADSGSDLASALGVTGVRLGRCQVVTGTSVDDVMGVVASGVDGGVDMVKVKVDPHRGVEAVEAIRRRYPDLSIAIDGNESLAGHDGLLDRLAAVGPAYIEQPGSRHDLPGHAAIARRFGVTVALDESVTGVDSIQRALEVGAAGVINIKPARMGGLVTALEAVDAARTGGAAVVVGGMVETGIGRRPAVVLAAIIAAMSGDDCLPTDLGPSAQYFDDDIATAVTTASDGRLVVPGGVGPDAGALARHVVRRMPVVDP